MLAATVWLVLASCIKNDLPYPRVQVNILTLAADGQSRPADIDSANLTATLFLDEQTDIRKVSFSNFSIPEGAEADPDLSEGVYDLAVPLQVTLTGWQSYQWVVKAEQTIERWFSVEGQIGATVIDPIGQRVVVKVPETADLSAMTITSVKLGPEGITTMAPDLKPGVFDFSHPVRVAVTAHGLTEEWTVIVEKTETTVSLTACDAWSRVIWAYGACKEGMEGRFQYRRVGAGEWTDVPQSETVQGDGVFSAAITRLEPLTEYEVRALAGEDAGGTLLVKTQATADLPDGAFDQWWLDGKVWCPWNEGGERFWDTGNKGAATLGQSNVVPTDLTPTGSGQAAKLETKFVGLGSIGKLAAGSIYTGSFQKVDGTNGILDFGRRWTLRPTKLKGYYRYETAPISHASSEYEYLKGRPDSCHIYVALADWTAPYEIRTNPKNRHLFDASSPSVIAYGQLVFSGTMKEYEEFEIVLVYRSTSRVPSYLQITAAASKYGDYFTGGAGAVLYVDQFSFSYDY